jgi:peptide-methionine (S)-S-oxide reductase
MMLKIASGITLGIVLFAAVIVVAVTTPDVNRTGQEASARVVPPPSTDEHAAGRTSAMAVVAGGCFWGVQAVFQHVGGVTSAISGYAGGPEGGAKYDLVSGGATGHAESVKITYDPRRISFGRLLQVYFSVAHDPTQLNRQGPDIGPQYRSAIFPMNDEQARIARTYIAQLNGGHAYPRAIVTTIETGRTFYPAEDYHQDYLALHPRAPYIVINDLPKLENLKRLFPDLYRADPVLVGSR